MLRMYEESLELIPQVHFLFMAIKCSSMEMELIKHWREENNLVQHLTSFLQPDHKPLNYLTRSVGLGAS